MIWVPCSLAAIRCTPRWQPCRPSRSHCTSFQLMLLECGGSFYEAMGPVVNKRSIFFVLCTFESTNLYFTCASHSMEQATVVWTLMLYGTYNNLTFCSSPTAESYAGRELLFLSRSRNPFPNPHVERPPESQPNHYGAIIRPPSW